MKMKKSKMKRELKSIITRQIQGLGYKIEKIEEKIKHLNEVKDSMDPIIEDADILFGNKPISEESDQDVEL